MASQFVKLALMLLSAKSVASYCSSKTFFAYTSSQSILHYHYSNNEGCTFSIQPSRFYSSGYYLEITWSTFDVKGDMPDCKNDYVEVLLTSSYRSIGKYCSNNLKTTKLFDMYSSDGYAKIKFRSDGSNTGLGFSLTYKLKSISSQYLGRYTSTSCSSLRYSQSGNIYSQGWPRTYASSYSTCNQAIQAGSVSTKIAIMDVQMKTSYYYYCSTTNYVRVKGSDYSLHGYYAITSKMCSKSSINSYTAKYKYINFEFDRSYSTSSGYGHGFMAGYIQYDAKKTQYHYSSSSSSNLGALIGGVVGGVVGLLLIILIPICLCKHSGNRGATVGNGQTTNTVAMGGTNVVTGTTAQQTGTTTMPVTVNTSGQCLPASGYPISQGITYMSYPTAAYSTSAAQPIPTESQAYPQVTQADGTPQQAYPPTSAPFMAGNQGQPMYYNQPPPPYNQVNPLT